MHDGQASTVESGVPGGDGTRDFPPRVSFTIGTTDIARTATAADFLIYLPEGKRLLVPGSTERPTCRCGEVMEVATIERLPEGSDAAIRVYRCTACGHEMRLTVWATVT
jgi:hypothetical protein